jgi:hypothetical protein
MTKVNNSAIEALITDVTMTTCDKLFKIFMDRYDLNDIDDEFSLFCGDLKDTLRKDVKGYVDKFTLENKEPKKEAKKETKEPKQKRAPFIKEKMAEIKISNPEIKGRALMMAAIDQWKIIKANKP